jgi:hypothetical protein
MSLLPGIRQSILDKMASGSANGQPETLPEIGNGSNGNSSKDAARERRAWRHPAVVLFVITDPARRPGPP